MSDGTWEENSFEIVLITVPVLLLLSNVMIKSGWDLRFVRSWKDTSWSKMPRVSYRFDQELQKNTDKLWFLFTRLIKSRPFWLILESEVKRFWHPWGDFERHRANSWCKGTKKSIESTASNCVIDFAKCVNMIKFFFPMLMPLGKLSALVIN
jgi:hypothetical protein